MATREYKNQGVTKASLWVAASFVSIAVITVLYMRYASQLNSAPLDRALVEKLESAKHFQSQFPAQRQTLDLAKKSSLRHAALNAIGMELRDVRGMATGYPESVFAMLSHPLDFPAPVF